MDSTNPWTHVLPLCIVCGCECECECECVCACVIVCVCVCTLINESIVNEEMLKTALRNNFSFTVQTIYFY
jgi:hypothetical protein